MNKPVFTQSGEPDLRYRATREYLARKKVNTIMGLVVAWFLFVFFLVGVIGKIMQRPVSGRESAVKTTEVQAVVHLPTPTPTDIPVAIRKWRGIASYYSRSGCLGCSPNLTMANGQPLDDDALTVAFNKLPLGSKVRILNAKNMMTVEAVVTDRGGFERLGRIIDVTPKVKSMLNCSDLCEVIVEQI